MIRGLGCDVCAISRMQKIMENPRFLERWFTPYEREYIGARKMSAQSAAGLFAAKEAFGKALGTGISGIAPDKVSIRHDAHGAPYYDINEAMKTAMEQKGAQFAHLSISHDGDVALAVAILEGTA